MKTFLYQLLGVRDQYRYRKKKISFYINIPRRQGSWLGKIKQVSLYKRNKSQVVIKIYLADTQYVCRFRFPKNWLDDPVKAIEDLIVAKDV